MKKLTAALLALMLVLSLCACDTIEGIISPECTVTFDLNGGTAGEGFAESVTVKKGETVPMTTPTKENFAFLGWFDGDTLYTAETPIEKDVTLVAQWSFANTYTLTFETNGMADVPKMHPVVGELPAIPATPVVDGYVFFGWYIDAELTNRYFFDYPLTEDTTLYAKFYDTTLGEYIVLSNVEQLMAVKDAPDAKYLLACDINCKGETLVPIDEFTGELEGNGYKIHNYSLTEGALNVALIRTNRGTIKNLSFNDFTFDILINGRGEKFYGAVCGINYGTVENCTVFDGIIDVVYGGGSGGNYSILVGGLVGHNIGVVTNCKNNTTLDVSTTQGGYYNYVYLRVGGIVGYNDTDAVISNCTNNGNLNVLGTTFSSGAGNGAGHYYLGGITAESYGDVINSHCVCDMILSATGPSQSAGIYIGGAIGKDCGSTKNSSAKSNITIKSDKSNAWSHIGGFVGNMSGNLENCSAQGMITIDNSGSGEKNYVGGFAGYTCGKLYNCYSANNITDNTAAIKAIGGFAGYNEKLANMQYVIHKCFSTGSISISGTAENVGKFIGLSTGTERDCAYLDTMTIINTTVVDGVETTETVEPTNTIGNAMAEKDLLSVDFLENTLYFDRMVWFLVEGKLPALR